MKLIAAIFIAREIL